MLLVKGRLLAKLSLSLQFPFHKFRLGEASRRISASIFGLALQMTFNEKHQAPTREWVLEWTLLIDLGLPRELLY